MDGMKGGIPHWNGYRRADIRTHGNPPHAPIPIGAAIAPRRDQPDRQNDEAKQTRPAGNTLAGEITINLFDPNLHGMLRTLGLDVAGGFRGNLRNETDATLDNA